MENNQNANAAVQVYSPQPVATQDIAVFSAGGFELAQRIGNALCKSNLVPEAYQNNLPNALVALEMAQRIGASPLMVMQNLNVIHGRPSWSSTFIIAAISTCGKFSPLRFELSGEGDGRTCIAWATDRTGERLESPPVSIKMAKDEGWFNKNGSKWKTMPELMLRYRAAAFFGRLYAPDVLMGMQASDEVEDITYTARPAAAAQEPAPVNSPATNRPASTIAEINRNVAHNSATESGNQPAAEGATPPVAQAKQAEASVTIEPGKQPEQAEPGKGDNITENANANLQTNTDNATTSNSEELV